MKLGWKLLLIPPVLVIYGLIFRTQEKMFQGIEVDLQPLPGYRYILAISGYLHQIVAEISFVETAVFLGGVKAGTEPSTYSVTLAHNYQQITKIYPEFIDPYFYSQSYLAGVNNEATNAVNEILSTGMLAHPENLVLPFFQGFNFFRYLDEPLQASKIFTVASMLPNAPPMFSHLAAILSAEGGQLEASIHSLRAMIQSADDETVKRRYHEEMEMFQQAYIVQQAVWKYSNEKQSYPKTLDQLVPNYIEKLPDFGNVFNLTWKPPTVGLKRPDR